MEKTVRNQQIIKWQVILGAVVCAMVAFCVLPNFSITGQAANAVEYIDRTWDEDTNTVKEEPEECSEYTELNENIWKLGKDKQETWFVLPKDIDHNRNEKFYIRGTVNLILEDGCTLTATNKDSMYIEDGATLNVYGQSQGTGKIVVDGGSGDAGLRVGSSCTLNIKGGTIEAEGTTGGAGIGGDDEESAGTINIYGGTVTAEGSNYGAGIGGGDEGAGGTVKIYGGTVNATGGKEAAGIGSGNEGGFGGMTEINGGTVTATGGKYGAGIGGGDESGAGTITTNNGIVNAIGGKKACGIGTGYEGGGGSVTIDGGTITATKGEDGENDIGNSSITFIHNSGTINGKGKDESEKLDELTAVEYKESVWDGSKVNETDGKCKHYTKLTKDICKNGLTEGWYVLSEDIDYNNYEKISIRGTVNLILEDGCTLTATKKDSMYIEDGATLNVYGQSQGTGKLYLDGQTGNAGLRVGSSCTLNIKGGTIEAEGTTGGVGIGGDDGESAGNINIYGGKVTANGGKNGAGIGGGDEGAGGNITIYGGTVKATGGEYGAGIGCGDGGAGGNITIYGGTVNATGGKEAAGIGGGDEGAGGNITIYGGTVNATGGEEAAGIGSGNEGGLVGMTEINGGTVKATGGEYGAGIGGGFLSNGGKTTINGGTVKATGGEYGAGIGGGNGITVTNFLRFSTIKNVGGNGGETTINGGTVTATGSHYGAGIGGGYKGNGGTTTISGGTVTATGSNYAAGIGGGNAFYHGDDVYNITGGNGGITTISGGKVTAKGGKDAAGIGGAQCGNGGTTTISGGTVTATGSSYGAGIGGGGKGFGIGGAGGETTISGGTVKATGGEKAAGIGGGGDINSKTCGEEKELPKHTITLEGVTEEVEVVGVNSGYGVNDVYTLDKGKLYFYMSDEEYAKLTEITVKDKDGKEQVYIRIDDKDTFKLITRVNITGVKAQDGKYNGLPQQGYTGTPTNDKGYTGEYEFIYYVKENPTPTPSTPSQSQSSGETQPDWKKTTPKNSGAEGEGKAPVYAGEYKVRIAVPNSNKKYEGYCELEFKVEKATPKKENQPTLSGRIGKTVGEMNIDVTGAKVIGVNGEELEGEWKIKDEEKAKVFDIDAVMNNTAYEVIFRPTDTRNYNTVTEMVVPKIDVGPIIGNIESVKCETSDEKNQNLIEKLKEKLSDPDVKDNLKSLLSNNSDFRNKVKEKFLNSKLIGDEIKSEVRNRLSDLETRKRIRDKILTSALITNPEIKERLKGVVSDLDVKNNLRNDITNSELIKDEKVREKLLSLIEE